MSATRLLILDLSPSLTSQTLRTYLSSIPKFSISSLTDLKLLSKRGLAFVGFKTHEDAQIVFDWIKGAWVEGRRVKVEWAEDIVKKPPGEKKKRKREQVQENKIGVERKFAKSSNWKQKIDSVTPSTTSNQPSNNTNDSSKEGVKSMGTEKEDVEMNSDEEEELERQREKENQGTDVQWLLSHRARNLTPPPSPPQDKPSQNIADSLQPETELNSVTKEDAPQHTRLFLRNLPFSTTADELREHFSTYGELTEVLVPESTGSSKGLAYLSYSTPASATSAKEDWDGRIFQGRLLHIIPCQSRRVKEEEIGENGKKKNLKDKKLEEKKNGIREWEWANLFLNADAVVDQVSKRLGVDKETVLDPRAESSTNPAVRLAIAETSVVNSTRQFFISRGLDLTAKSPKKDDCTILVKNLPAQTSESLLKNMFANFGQVERFEMPPSGGMAVVKMGNEEEGRAAFRGLAYRRIGSAVLYLEKGPEGIWKGKPMEDTFTTDQMVEEGDEGDKSKEKEEEDVEVGEGATLFIKNLSFNTTTETLTSLARSFPGFVFARVQTRPDPKDKTGKARLSMGFGFIGFRDKVAAKRAMGVLDGRELDGHKLEVKWAQRDVDLGAKKGEQSKVKSSTKIIVKNLPFEASKKDLRDLFSNYGTLKSVRLPKKFTNQTRGFGFVEFTSKKEAELAMETLKHTHLLGRHLVLQYEEAEKGVEELREEKRREGVGKESVRVRKEQMRGIEREMGEMVGRKDGDGDEEMMDDE